MRTPEPVGQFLEKLSASLSEATFVRLVLSRVECRVSNVEPGLRTSHFALREIRHSHKLLVRLVSLKGAPHLSLAFHDGAQALTKNLPVAEAIDQLRAEIGKRFRSGLLCTTKGDWQLFAPPKGRARLIGHRPTSVTVPSSHHDQTRRSMLDDSARDWLQGLGLLDRAGKPRASMADKHRQIHRYLEIIAHLAADCGWTNANVESRMSSAEFDIRSSSLVIPTLVIADMGCGKGYLTFGAWHLFTRVFRIPARVIGVEERPTLVEAANTLVHQIHAGGLEFVAGTIASTDLPRLDALIALHACDTATDDAIRRGIDLNAKLIVLSPCCHKELRPQLSHPRPLSPVLRHGIMEERAAEWLTDGLRALYLEWAGYETKVFEFISSEHTPRNVMISAVKRNTPFASPLARTRIEDLKRLFGIKHHALDSLLQVTTRIESED